MRVCKKDYVEACMKIYMKVSMNIECIVQFGNFPSKFAMKFTLNFTAEVAKRQCSKLMFMDYN